MHTYRQSRSTVMNDVSSRSHCLARLNLSVVTGEDLGQVRTNQNTASGHVTPVTSSYWPGSGWTASPWTSRGPAAAC